MGNAKRLLSVVLALTFLLYNGVHEMYAQSDTLPDIVSDTYVCLLSWDGNIGGEAVLRFIHQVRNASSVPVTESFETIVTDYPGTIGSGVGMRYAKVIFPPLGPWETFVHTYDYQVTRWAGTANAGTQPDIGVSEPCVGLGCWMGSGWIRESNENNNNSSWTGTPTWCPGYGLGRIRGYIFFDKNRNGRKDPGEVGIKNATVLLWEGRRMKKRTVAQWPSGQWILEEAGGTYSISAIIPSPPGGGAWQWTTPKAYYGIRLNNNDTIGPFYFGVFPVPPSPPRAYYSSPTLRIETTPQYPVVIGQDPTERGADISVVVISPPALFEWYEWDNAQGKYVKRQEKVPVPVIPGSVELYGSMTAASRDWVRLDLAARYPGASVRRGEWDMARDVGLRVVENRTLADGTTILRATAFRVPFMDPGTYTLRASAKVRSVTHAKSGLTVPQRTVSGSGAVHVYVKDSMLR